MLPRMLGLFPFDQITPDKTPVVAKAARLTLDDKLRRLEDTEWTRGNFIHFFARLRDGEAANKQLRALFKKWVPGGSLLTVSWGNIFCLDGNTAGTSGVSEMLLQSHSDQIELLPALPTAWKNGSVRGLCARGGFTVDMDWKDGKVIKYQVASATAREVKICVNGLLKTVKSQQINNVSQTGTVKEPN